MTDDGFAALAHRLELAPDLTCARETDACAAEPDQNPLGRAVVTERRERAQEIERRALPAAAEQARGGGFRKAARQIDLRDCGAALRRSDRRCRPGRRSRAPLAAPKRPRAEEECEERREPWAHLCPVKSLVSTPGGGDPDFGPFPVCRSDLSTSPPACGAT